MSSGVFLLLYHAYYACSDYAALSDKTFFYLYLPRFSKYFCNAITITFLDATRSGLDSVRGLSIRILSKRYSPVYMESILGDFLSSQRAVLNSLTDEEVSHMCEAIIKSLEDPPTTYTEEAGEFYGRIKSGLPFDWTEKVIEELRAVKAACVAEAANKWLYDINKRNSVSVMLFGCSEAHQADLQAIKDGVVTLDAVSATAATTATTTSTTACSTEARIASTSTSTSTAATFFPPYSVAVTIEDTATGSVAVDGTVPSSHSRFSDSSILNSDTGGGQVRQCVFSIDDMKSVRDSLELF